MEIKIVKSKSRKKLPIVSWLIMAMQKTDYSHMSLHVKYYSTSPWVAIDVTKKDGFEVNTLEKWLGNHIIVEEKVISKHISMPGLTLWIHGHLGKQYDQKQLIGLTLKGLNLITFNTIGHNYKKMTCNELILSFAEYFFGKDVDDSDNYDLNMTWDIARDLT